MKMLDMDMDNGKRLTDRPGRFISSSRTDNDRDDQHEEYHHHERNQCNTDSKDGNWWESGQCSSGETIIVLEHHPNDSRIKVDNSGTIQTLTSRMGTGGGNVPMVIEIRYAERK